MVLLHNHHHGVESVLRASTDFEVRLAVAFPLVRKACICRLRAAVSYRRITPDADLNCKIANESRVSRRVSARGAIGRGCRHQGRAR